MRLVIISDTHTLHEQLDVLSGDVLIHCGDMCNGFVPDEYDRDRMDRWFGKQEFDLILCTGGNHDLVLEEHSDDGLAPFANARYLVGESVEFGGVRFFAAPWVPKLEGWAYFQNDEGLREKWDEIPDDTMVLVTHTPPFGVLDLNPANKPQGCPLLRNRIEELDALQLHAFGHIHEGYGQKNIGGVRFVNAALQGGKRLRSPITIDL